MNAAQDDGNQGTPLRGPCLVAGCPCKDARIVSRRKAAYFASVARTSGETADRIIPVDPEWRIPTDLPSVHPALGPQG